MPSRSTPRATFTWGGAAVCDDARLAYLTNRRVGKGIWELGVVGHGNALAGRVAGHVRCWDPARPPRIELHPAGTPDERLAGAHVIDKRDSRLAIYWPDLVARITA
ncbi:hypothetical protein [Flindersiella endophytica]